MFPVQQNTAQSGATNSLNRNVILSMAQLSCPFQIAQAMLKRTKEDLRTFAGLPMEVKHSENHSEDDVPAATSYVTVSNFEHHPEDDIPEGTSIELSAALKVIQRMTDDVPAATSYVSEQYLLL